MGAWGSGNFQNDCALDWVDLELENSADLSCIENTLSRVANFGAEYLQVDDGAEALAAAEVLAALKGLPAEDLPDSVTSWVAQHPASVDARLIGLALRAITRVRSLGDSELPSLWEGNDEWSRVVEALEKRLQQ